MLPIGHVAPAEMLRIIVGYASDIFDSDNAVNLAPRYTPPDLPLQTQQLVA